MSQRTFALLFGAVAIFVGAASAQTPTSDPAPLPSIKGKVAQYILTPQGDVEGLILDDGTEVQVSPHASLNLVFAVRPGDQVTIHGLKAHAIPMVRAMTVTNDATHVTAVTELSREERGDDADVETVGRIKAKLHDDDGDVDGVLLEDGTTIHLPDPEAVRLSAQLAVGRTIYVRGTGVANLLGRDIAARFIGPDKQIATAIQGASEDDQRGHEGRDRDGRDDGDH